MEQQKTNKRLLALDILRGITIAGMILVNNPGSYSHIYAPLKHAEWNGLTPTDLVFPFFMFIMGISTYLSLNKSRFQSSPKVIWKVLKRTTFIFLIGLAINWFSLFCFYWSSAPQELGFAENLWISLTSWEHLRILGVMQRLALCYGIASLIALQCNHRYIPYLIASLLLGYGVVLWSGNGFEYNENNLLSIIDKALLTPPHMYFDNGIDPEGILSTIPAIAHVLLGFWVGKLMQGNQESPKSLQRATFLQSQLITLLLLGVILTFSGLLLSYGCPINKKIWSPTFVLVTCGFASSLLALLIWIIDFKGYKRWALFFESFGVNPLFLYVIASCVAIVLGSIQIPVEDTTISLQSFIYTYLLQPAFGNYGGSLCYALLYVMFNWSIGFILFKKGIIIKL